MSHPSLPSSRRVVGMSNEVLEHHIQEHIRQFGCEPHMATEIFYCPCGQCFRISCGNCSQDLLFLARNHGLLCEHGIEYLELNGMMPA